MSHVWDGQFNFTNLGIKFIVSFLRGVLVSAKLASSLFERLTFGVVLGSTNFLGRRIGFRV